MSRRLLWLLLAATLVVTTVAVVVAQRTQDDTSAPQIDHTTTESLTPRRDEPPRPGVLSPEQFGAVGDGETDDTVAVQAAADAAAGRTLRLADDTTYLLTRSLLVPSHTTMVGGDRSVLQFDWESADAPGAGGPFYLGNENQEGGDVDIVLSGFVVRGPSSGLPLGPYVEPGDWKVPAIRLRLVDTFVISQLEVAFVPAGGILYQGGLHGRLVDNYVHDTGRDGILGTSLGQPLADVVLARNLLERVGDDAIAIAGATTRSTNSSVLPSGIRIIDNEVRGWDENPNGLALGRGVALLAVKDVVVADNTISRTASAGILLRGAPSDDSIDPSTGEPWVSSSVTIVRNTIVDAGSLADGSSLSSAYQGENGIEVSDARDIHVGANSIDVARGAELEIEDCDRCAVQATG